MTKLMVMVPIVIQMVLNSKDNGLKISKRVKELNAGQMEPVTKEIIKLDKKMVMVISNGQMVVDLTDNFKKITYMAMEPIVGVMEDNIKENGETIRCTEKEFLLGQMEENTMVIMLMTRNKDMVNLFGLTERSIKDIGKMVSNMELDIIQDLKLMRNKENGLKVKE